jgi:hypothetical protein
VISLFLPIGSCDRKHMNEPHEPSEILIDKDEGSDTNEKVVPKSEIEYLVLIEDVSLTEPSSWISLFAFLWPIPFLILKSKVATSKRKRIIFSIVELLLVSFSVYFIYFVVLFFWYDPTFWGYLVVIVISIYALLYLAEIFLLLRKRQQTKI